MGYLSVTGIIAIAITTINTLYFTLHTNSLMELLGKVFWTSASMVFVIAPIVCGIIFIYYFVDFIWNELFYGV